MRELIPDSGSGIQSGKFVIYVLCFLLGLAMYQTAAAQQSNGSRSFYLGFTYQPHDWSQTAFDETYDFIGRNSDLIFHYLDDGVPWPEAHAGTPFHRQVESNLDNRLKRLGADQKIAVGVNFLGRDRRSLADYWGEHDGLPRSGVWAGLAIGDDDVIAAYTAYCRSLIRRFKPDYFIYGMEVDSVNLDVSGPAFQNLEKMIAGTYTSLRKEFPGLALVLTFFLGPDEDLHQRMSMVQRLLAYTDIYAVSTYPYLFDGIGGNSENIPADLFSRVRRFIGDKPFAVAETGFNAKPWRVPSRLIWIPGSEESQAAYIEFLLAESNKLNAEFVNWWVPRDLDAIWQIMKASGADPMLSQWNSNGITDADGKARPGLTVWRRWLNKKMAR